MTEINLEWAKLCQKSLARPPGGLQMRGLIDLEVPG
jgi:hypothetical protein